VISAVIDPSVLVSAFIGRPEAGPGQVVAAWRDGRFTMIVSPLLLEELAEVLARRSSLAGRRTTATRRTSRRLQPAASIGPIPP
jgi:predicted nucleic acid-binding protein